MYVILDFEFLWWLRTHSLALGGGGQEPLAEAVPVVIGLSVLDLDLGVVVGQLEDNVSQESVLVVASLELLELLGDRGGNFRSKNQAYHQPANSRQVMRLSCFRFFHFLFLSFSPLLANPIMRPHLHRRWPW